MTDPGADDPASAPSRRVKSVETTLDIVHALRSMDGGTVTELAERTGMSKATVYKHLHTLAEHDYVVKEGNVYRLGFRFLDLGGYSRSRFVGAELIKPTVRELADRTNEVALFNTEENARSVTLFRENGARGVFTRTRLGKRLYLHQNASGKAILAHLPPARVEEIVDEVGLPRATEHTITDPDALYQELEEIRERGYAYNVAESTKGLIGVAAPLVPDEQVLGAVAVAGPRHRMEGDRLADDIPDRLLSAVNELELNIAHRSRRLPGSDDPYRGYAPTDGDSLGSG